MATTTVIGRLRRAWATVSMRGLDPSNRTESRAVMGANNFYILTAVANLPWALVIMAHNDWSFLLPGLTHLAMIAVWLAGLSVNGRGYAPWMSAASIAAAIAQYSFLADVFTRAAGFQLAFFVIPTLALAMFTPRHAKLRVAAIVAAILAAAWVYLDPRFGDAWVPETDRWLMVTGALMFASVLCLLVAQAAFADFYFNRERRHNSVLLAEARTASHTDALTHLLNRRGITPLLTEAAGRGGYCLALAR